MKSPSSALGSAIRAANQERTKQSNYQSGKPGIEDTSLPVSALDQRAEGVKNLNDLPLYFDWWHWDS